MPDEILEGISLPFNEAIDFFRQKARVPTDHWTDVWRTAHSHSFMVAGAASDALLADFQKEISRALRDGTTLADFRKSFDDIVDRHGWSYNGTPGWRSRIIYETNLSTAYSAGRYDQLTQPDTLKAFPYWTYIHSGSRHPRLQHLAWNGLTLRADDPFWDTHYPPNGWRCGCRASATSRGGLGRMGKDGPDTAPPIEYRDWVNPRNGTVHKVPAGIDPGFDYNPGKAWKQGADALPVKASPLRPLKANAQDDVWRKAMQDFVESPTRSTSMTVGNLDKDMRDVLGTETPDVLLSADTMEKQLFRHPELKPETYLSLPELFDKPDAVIDYGDRRILLLRAGGKALAAVVKATKDSGANYLVSLHEARPKSVRSMLRKGRLVKGDVDWAE
jgi:hypothetical protein